MRWHKLFGTICLCLTVLLGRAQLGRADYSAQWKVVDSLLGKGLLASALTAVNGIYAKAKNEHRTSEEIKAIIYRASVRDEILEGADTSIVRDIEKLIPETDQPAKSILESELAAIYWQYFQQHWWEFRDRTASASATDKDMSTWTIEDFHRRIGLLFEQSLADARLLQRTGLDEWSAVLIIGNTPRIRPTLFDILAQEALRYYSSMEMPFNQVVDEFELDDSAAFAPAAEFAGHRFSSPDSASLPFHALLLYQRLIAFHLTDNRPDALMDVDLDRISFMRRHTILQDADDRYLAALQQLTASWNKAPVVAQAWYMRAEFYREQAKEAEKTGDSSGLSGMAKAKAICEQVLAEKDSSEGRTNCRVLQESILRPTLNLQVEEFNIPRRPFRCLVKWSNFDQLYLRIIRLDSFGRGEEVREDNIDTLLRKKKYISLFQALPKTNDYLTHSAEIPIGSLPSGTYVLVGSAYPISGTRWDGSQQVISSEPFYITSIAWIQEDKNCWIVDRESGQPLNDVRIQNWNRLYDHKADRWRFKLTSTYHTDQEGHFGVQPQNGHPIFVELQRPNEDIYISSGTGPAENDNQINSMVPAKEEYEHENMTAAIFLDRSIYRPGQTVYFKSITLTRDFDSKHYKILPSRAEKIVLLNTNDERIDSLMLTTDEFGACHGFFHLPANQLNGSWQIVDDSCSDHANQSFRVEEYKRPRFDVSFDPIKKSYRVNDSIQADGHARAYAGNNLDRVRVKYRITRENVYLYGFHFRQSIPAGSRNKEIAHGETMTDQNGNFQLIFKALADRRLRPADNVKFSYRIEADVTDLNGESRSGSTDVTVGYSMLEVTIGLGDFTGIPADSLKHISADVRNLSGKPVISLVTIAAYPIEAPTRLIRERLWEVPDRWVMPESSFVDSFPHDPYRDENNIETWARGVGVWQGVDSTGGHDLPIRLGPGWWLIEATAKDGHGQIATDKRYVELLSPSNGEPPGPEYVWGSRGGSVVDAKLGEAVLVETGSSAAEVHLIREIQHAGDQDSAVFEQLTISRGKKVTPWAISKADRGGVLVADAFVKDNRFFTHPILVNVPWDNKQLEIQYRSFRDKTEPGDAEHWALNISGSGGSQAASQVLTSMYDASLDQFDEHSWSAPPIYPTIESVSAWAQCSDFGAISTSDLELGGLLENGLDKHYYSLLMPWSIRRYIPGIFHQNTTSFSTAPMAKYTEPGLAETKIEFDKFTSPRIVQDQNTVIRLAPASGEKTAIPIALPPLIRTNFNETAFFFPDLRTDSLGNVSFSFTMPESLTQWKWMTLAHTRDLAFGYSEKTIITQKQLMVQPNAPRFLREGDKINLSVKVVNLTDSEMTGQLGLSLTDPTTGEPADGWFLNRQPNQYFTVPARGSSVVEFPVEIPYQYNRPVSYRIVAEAGRFSDGEQAMLPVVSNRMLVTETLPLNMPGDGVRSFKFEKLLASGSSETLNHHALTVEFTANPAWYAVQALPYLMEYPYECAEQTFDRLYANAVAGKIVSGSPRIAQVFERWRTVDTSALLSNLEKDPELKSVLLEETPWVLEGKTETQQKKNIALLFDLTKLSGQLRSTIDRLGELQAEDGGFPWFKGGPDDRYVTQYILTGLGRLKQMQALPPALVEKVKTMVTAALGYADREIKADYDLDLKTAGGIHRIYPFVAQYLYMRSLFNDYGIPGSTFPAVNFYRKVAQQEWVKADKFIQGMVALALFRTGDVATARSILASLRETSIRNEELGMYWKGMEGGYYWYQAPVETEALMIETFREIGHDTAADRQLKTWLLRQKQTHQWASTKATADAVYALLTGGSDWLDQQREVKVQLGDKVVEMGGEAGTGYDKKIFDAPFIDSSMGHIKVSMTSAKRGGSPAWGAVYWQYFDQLDQITPAEGGAGSAGGARAPLRVEKRLYVQRNTDRGPVLDTIPDLGTLHVGDRVVVRLVVRSDRDFEYVHLKDMRGACLEPVNALSGYRWQGGLGYYESTKDVSTEFFFPSVPKGVYVFEYPLVVEQAGEFSNGVASVECLYAPEFAFHTEGIRVNVEEGR